MFLRHNSKKGIWYFFRRFLRELTLIEHQTLHVGLVTHENRAPATVSLPAHISSAKAVKDIEANKINNFIFKDLLKVGFTLKILHKNNSGFSDLSDGANCLWMRDFLLYFPISLMYIRSVAVLLASLPLYSFSFPYCFSWNFVVNNPRLKTSTFRFCLLAFSAKWLPQPKPRNIKWVTLSAAELSQFRNFRREFG